MATTTHYSYKIADGPLAGERYALSDDHFLNDGGHYRRNVALATSDGRRAMYARNIDDFNSRWDNPSYEWADGARILRFVGWTI